MTNSDLLRFRKKQKYLFADLETFNLNGAVDNVPWQVSFLVGDLDNVYELQDHYLSWGRVPCDEVKKLTNYSQKRMDAEGRDPAELYPIFREYLDNPEYIIVGHNFLGFDVPLERLWAKAVGAKHDYNYTRRVVDSLALAKSYRFNKPVDHSNLLGWQNKMDKEFQRGQKCKLSELATEFGIDYDPDKLHDGAYDIILNQKVFRELIYKVEI